MCLSHILSSLLLVVSSRAQSYPTLTDMSDHLLYSLISQNGDSGFLQNDGIHLLERMISQHRKLHSILK
jgi:hypothetical protein